MATVTETIETPPVPETDSADVHGMGGLVVLHGVSWKLYRKLRRMPENRNIRMTYDRGELEIMSPSALHEKIASLIGSLIEVWRMEFRIPMVSCRTMTIRRSILERGFEPDNCYHVQHEPQMWDKTKINFKEDPPPDLAIEVEVSRRLLGKTGVYSAFRVPELWWWRNDTLTVLELKGDEYVDRQTSVCFPNFPIAKAQEVVRQLGAGHETELVCSFRDWVRENVTT